MTTTFGIIAGFVMLALAFIAAYADIRWGKK